MGWHVKCQSAPNVAKMRIIFARFLFPSMSKHMPVVMIPIQLSPRRHNEVRVEYPKRSQIQRSRANSFSPYVEPVVNALEFPNIYLTCGDIHKMSVRHSPTPHVHFFRWGSVVHVLHAAARGVVSAQVSGEMKDNLVHTYAGCRRISGEARRV